MNEVKVTIGSPGVVARAEPAPLRPVINPPIARAITPAQEYAGPYEVTPALVGIVLPTAGRLMTQDVKIAPAPTPGTYMGPYNVTPGASPIVLETAGLQMALDVTVAAAAAGAVYETGTWAPSENIARGEISFANAHTEAPFLIALADCTNTNYSTDYTVYTFLYLDTYLMWGAKVPRTASTRRGAAIYSAYRSTSTTTFTGRIDIDPTGSAEGNNDYWTTNEKFFPYANNAERMFRAGRTYKWVAIWRP